MPELTKPQLKYLLFLSPRTPRPKGIDNVTPGTRRKLYDLGLVQMHRPDDWTAGVQPPGNAALVITDAGERALDAAGY